MGLILKNKIPSLMRGYPTVSDKYDVAPAVFESGSNVPAGALVALTGTAGRYTPVGTSTTINQIAGFLMATNVKVPNTYPASTSQQTYNAGDAFNLMIKGFIAAPIKVTDGELAALTNGQAVYVMIGGTAAPGAITVEDHTEATGTATLLPGAYYTGLTEVVNGETLAEICYNL